MSWTVSFRDVSYSASDDGVRTYSADYLAITTNGSDHVQQAVVAVQTVYPYGTPYAHGNDADAYCYARRPTGAKRIKPVENRRAFIVTIPYTNKPGDRCQSASFDDPLTIPPKISGSFISKVRAATQDINGQLVANSADEPIIPAFEVPDSDDTIIIEFNAATINLDQRAEFRDKVNSTTIWGLTAGKVLLSNWHWSKEFYGTCSYYIANRLEFSVRYDTWAYKTLDQGFRVKNGVDADGKTKYKELKDDRDERLRKPRLLDGNGALLNNGANPIELSFDLIDEVNFSLISGLPSSLF